MKYAQIIAYLIIKKERIYLFSLLLHVGFTGLKVCLIFPIKIQWMGKGNVSFELN